MSAEAKQAAVWAADFDLVAQADAALAMAMTAQRDAAIEHDWPTVRKCAELILQRAIYIDHKVKAEFIREIEHTFKPAALGKEAA